MLFFANEIEDACVQMKPSWKLTNLYIPIAAKHFLYSSGRRGGRPPSTEGTEKTDVGNIIQRGFSSPFFYYCCSNQTVVQLGSILIRYRMAGKHPLNKYLNLYRATSLHVVN
ncbi:hypothetical protein HPP92_013850 [Vanilla planifolia]|uniref:Uncharacterized protein n=1 Tax=Vanilla planifolia TaxID=51239 RepID=A0A835QXR5_VANPL|nr:hypothetical protein HPP92_013850 [Vanilla planifolia]